MFVGTNKLNSLYTRENIFKYKSNSVYRQTTIFNSWELKKSTKKVYIQNIINIKATIKKSILKKFVNHKIVLFLRILILCIKNVFNYFLVNRKI